MLKIKFLPDYFSNLNYSNKKKLRFEYCIPKPCFVKQKKFNKNHFDIFEINFRVRSEARNK